jgi:hypothetical protein
MAKTKMKYIILALACCLVSNIVFAGDNEKAILRQYLVPGNVAEQQKAFNVITANPNKYRNLVLTELQRFSSSPDNTPDALLYLAAFIRDPRYIRPLSKLINNALYSEDHCIYACPIVFSLVVFSSFAGYTLPRLDEKLTAVQDLKSQREWVKRISPIREPVSKYVQGPGIDQLLHDLGALPLSEVIRIAGPETTDANKRMAAAFVLEAHVVDDRHLKELYWLAINNLPNDASAEYRAAIHQAIYKAETHKKSNKP